MGDIYHPASNKTKMAEGIPLQDDDRWPWLEILGSLLANNDCVLACSALKKSYRSLLIGYQDVVFVYLKGSHQVLSDRLNKRSGHYMKVSMLSSQLEILEEPDADECKCITVDIEDPLDESISNIIMKTMEMYQKNLD